MPGVRLDALGADEGAVGTAYIHDFQTRLAPSHLGVVAGRAWVAENHVVVGFAAYPDRGGFGWRQRDFLLPPIKVGDDQVI